MISVNWSAARRGIARTSRFFPILLIIAVAMSAQEVLTNDAIIRMVKAKLSESVIVEKIRSSPGRYSLTTDNLIELSRQGVPEKVILAMQAKQSASSPKASANTSSRERTSDRPKESKTPLDAETTEVEKAFWQKILPSCGDSRYYVGSELEIHIHGTRGGAARANNGLTEYAGVIFDHQRLAISPADQANGVERKATIFMFASRWRERTPGQPTWQEWVSPSADSNPFAALKLIASAPGHFGFTGGMAIELWKVKGEWFYLIPPEMDPMRQLIPASQVTEQKISCDAVLKNGGLPAKVPSAPDSVHCHDSLNNPVPVREVLRGDALRWCGITPQRWDELTGSTRRPELPVVTQDGVTWINGDPTFKDGNTTVKLLHSLIVIEQGSTSARFSLTAQGMGIILVPPPDARSRETYNSQTHQYSNSNPSNGDATGNYPNGPPPGMMRKLAPFAQVAMKAINQAKQTPGGTNWDDEYFRNILNPYNSSPASNSQ